MKTKFILGALALALVSACSSGVETETAPEPEAQLPAPQLPDQGAMTTRLNSQLAFWQGKVEKDPYDFIAYRTLADKHVALARAVGDESHYVKAEAALRESLRLHSKDNVAAKGRLASVRMAFHEFGEARDLVDEAIDEAPYEEWLFAVRGDAHFGLGDYSKALEDYQAFHIKAPGFASYSRLASVRFVFGDADDALRLYEKAAEESNGMDADNRAWARLMVGVQHLKRHDYVTARKHFGESLSIAPDYFLAMEHIAETFEAEGNDADARLYLETAIAIKREPELLERLADMEDRAGKLDLANELRKEAMEIVEARAAENGNGHLRTLAEMLMDRGQDLDRALSLAERDFEIRQDLNAHRVLARGLRLNGRAKEAVPYVEKMLRYATPDSELWEEAAAVYEAAGEDKKAAVAKAWLKGNVIA